MKTQNNLVKMNKRGRMLVASYEARCASRSSTCSPSCCARSAPISPEPRLRTRRRALNGDGNNPAEEMNGGSPAALSYDSLVKMWGAWPPLS